MSGRTSGVLVEPDRPAVTRELLGAAASLGGRVVALTVDEPALDQLGSWGADEAVWLRAPSDSGGVMPEEDVALGAIELGARHRPWAVFAPSTAWGREVASRTAAAIGAGLTGDAVGFELDGDRLIAWKPAFGGQLVAAIHADSRTQMATVRAGMLAELHPACAPTPTRATWRSSRAVGCACSPAPATTTSTCSPKRPRSSASARASHPRTTHCSSRCATALGAEIAATRKVTDRGWLPRARQVGITGRSIAPRLYVVLGASGKYNHMVGVRAAALGARDQLRPGGARLRRGGRRHRRRLA